MVIACCPTRCGSRSALEGDLPLEQQQTQWIVSSHCKMHLMLWKTSQFQLRSTSIAPKTSS